MAEGRPCAVLVRDACKKYGMWKEGIFVLDHLNLSAPQGCIYGLLGPSGCGKTTLLSCIVGTRKLTSGNIWVLGGRPGTKNSGVPGPRVGYMPQENAQVQEFTVKESIYYFGWINGMSGQELDDSYKKLSRLLLLPPSGRYMRNLSGGQMRRVSFACALVHTPELLILDEPTVGLDPILRNTIWNYLVDLAQEKQVTVIITTHYIEEARQADIIGLMRGGQLLAEQSPDDLIAAYNASSLEEVFLLLSRRQGDGTTPRLVQADTPSQVDSAMDVFENQKHKGVGESKETLVLDDFAELPPKTKHLITPVQRRSSKSQRTKALLYKNMIRLFRHPGGIFFVIIFPILEIAAFFLAIGGQPHGLKFAVVNDELGNYSDCGEYLAQNTANLTWLDDGTCHLGGKLSCQFLEAINDTMGVKVYYDDLDTAIYDLEKGRVVAVIYTARNFSQALETRLELGSSATDDEIVESQVIISVDTTDLQLSQDLKWRLLRLYLEFAENITIACQRPIKMAHIPIDFKDPVYGEKNPSYTVFMAPGVIVSLVYFLSVSLTSTILLVEKMDGVWGRTLVAGVTSGEVLLSHVISQMGQTFIQMVLILLMSLYVFGFEIQYNLALAVVLIALQATAGMTFGFLMSSLCEEIRTANYFSLGIFYPYLLTSGIMWPLEAMPTVLRYISYTMPGTLAIQSLRNLIAKDWTLLHPQVFGGFLSSIAYIVVQMSLCLLVMKYKKV